MMQVLSFSVFIASGWLFNVPFFTRTQPGVYILLLLAWCHVQSVMAFFLSIFFSNSKTAIVITVILVLLATNLTTLPGTRLPLSLVSSSPQDFCGWMYGHLCTGTCTHH